MGNTQRIATPAEVNQASKTRFIPEIAGARGLALTLVVLFHVFGKGRVSGGVDVFLFVSGYLMTAALVRRAEKPAGLSLTEQYRNTFVRLVPPAGVVLLATAVATLLVAPATVWEQTAREIAASGVYLLNWELINSQLAYGAAGPDASPLQHFWSLSVQGQFFVLWPALVAALSLLCIQRAWSLRRVVLGVLIVSSLASFAYAMVLTQQDQPVAYFSTTTRIWELGLGGILALTMSNVRLSRPVAAFMSWVGIALVVSCGFLIDGGSVFPGPWTLWPIAGIALVVVAAVAVPGVGAAAMLGTAPLRFFAAISYPLYLWHWPVLVLYLQFRDQPAVGVRGALGVLTLSIVLAWLTQQALGAPIDRLRPRLPAVPTLATLLAAVLVLAVVTGGFARHLQLEEEAELAAASQLSPDHPGAKVLGYGDSPIQEPDSQVPFRPSTAAADADLPADLYDRGCVQDWRNDPGMDEVLVCDDESISRPSKTIVMSGGSHVLQWYPAMRAVADANRWKVIVVDKDGCRLSKATEASAATSTCAGWNSKATDVIARINPDAVFTVGSKTPEEPGDAETASSGQVDAWRELSAAGVPVIAVRDTPRFLERVPECVEVNGPSDSCGRAREEIFAASDPVLDLPGIPPETALLDLTDAFCGPKTCDPIVGNVLAYRDQDHMTATYSRTLDRDFEAALKESAGWLFN